MMSKSTAAPAVTQHFKALDGWRGVAALLVALYHLPVAWHWQGAPGYHHLFLMVDFFFVLSGFVVTHAYGGRLNTDESAATFLVKRFGRLWPLHAFTILAVLAVQLVKLRLVMHYGDISRSAAFGTDTPLAHLPYQLLLLTAMGFTDNISWNQPSWSIGAEFYTYGVFLLAAAYRERVSPLVALGLIAACALLVLHGSPRYMDTTYDLGFARCVYGFFAGVLTYRVWQRYGHVVQRLPLEVPMLLVVGWFVFNFGKTSPWSVAAPLVFAPMVLIFAGEKGWISRMLVTRPLQSLGAWSYSVYMVHSLGLTAVVGLTALAGKLLAIPKPFPWLFRSATEKPVIFFHSVWAMDLLAILYLAGVVVVASLTYRFIERPGQRVVNRWWAQRQARKAGAAEPDTHKPA